MNHKLQQLLQNADVNTQQFNEFMYAVAEKMFAAGFRLPMYWSVTAEMLPSESHGTRQNTVVNCMKIGVGDHTHDGGVQPVIGRRVELT